jgi:hypothetical protein
VKIQGRNQYALCVYCQKHNKHFARPEREYQKAEKSREIYIVYTGSFESLLIFLTVQLIGK